jgi:hypothetical protein
MSIWEVLISRSRAEAPQFRAFWSSSRGSARLGQKISPAASRHFG